MMQTANKSSGQEKPSYYIILAPVPDAFLSRYELRDGHALFDWHNNPEKAVEFGEYEDAERVAHQILRHLTHSGNKRIRMDICAVTDTGRQLLVDPLDEIFGVDLPTMSPEAKAALPAFLELLRGATDEQWSQERIEQRAGALALEHQLNAQQLADAAGCASIIHAHELGDEDLAEQIRQTMIRPSRPSDN